MIREDTPVWKQKDDDGNMMTIHDGEDGNLLFTKYMYNEEHRVWKIRDKWTSGGMRASWNNSILSMIQFDLSDETVEKGKAKIEEYLQKKQN